MEPQSKKTVDNSIPNLRKGLGWWKNIAYTNPKIKVGPVRQWDLNFLLHCFPNAYEVISSWHTMVTMNAIRMKEREWQAKWKRERVPDGYMLVKTQDLDELTNRSMALNEWVKHDVIRIKLKIYRERQNKENTEAFMRRVFGDGGDV